MARHKRRIGTPLYVLLLVGAVVGDAIQALFKLLWVTGFLGIIAEGLSWFITGTIGMTFGLIFMLNNVKLLGPKNAFRTAATLFVEMTPILSAVPTLTIWVVGTVRQSRKEDKATQALEEKKEAEALRNARIRRTLKRAKQEQELGAQAVARATAEYEASERAKQKRRQAQVDRLDAEAETAAREWQTRENQVALLRKQALTASGRTSASRRELPDGPFERDETDPPSIPPGKTRRVHELT